MHLILSSFQGSLGSSLGPRLSPSAPPALSFPTAWPSALWLTQLGPKASGPPSRGLAGEGGPA